MKRGCHFTHFFLIESSLLKGSRTFRPAVFTPYDNCQNFRQRSAGCQWSSFLSCSLCSRSFRVEILSASCSGRLEGKIDSRRALGPASQNSCFVRQALADKETRARRHCFSLCCQAWRFSTTELSLVCSVSLETVKRRQQKKKLTTKNL